MLDEILERAQEIEHIANYTSVLTSRTLNEMTGCDVYIKCENFQRGGAFKFRGAYNAISQLSDEEKDRGIITHSSGNHAQAVAYVGKLQGIKTTIVMPDNAPDIKVDATRGYGAEIVFSEATIESRENACNKLIDEHGYTLIHPYDNRNVIIGAASASVELISETGPLDYIIAPIGGGGLISGTSAYSKLSGKVKYVIGAEPELANDAYLSLKMGEIQPQQTPVTIADGLRTMLSPLTFNFIKEHVDEIITVSETEIVEAMRFFWERMKIVIEPSSATVLAALIKGLSNDQIESDSKIGLIISGGNVALEGFFERINKQIVKN
jgi:threonine dehydratase